MSGEIPVKESRFLGRFMRIENMPFIIRMAEEERNELKFLLTGVPAEITIQDYGSIYSSVYGSYKSLESMVNSIIPKTEIVSTKTQANEILSETGPYFYELTGTEKVKHPHFVIKTGNAFLDFLKLGTAMNKIVIPLSIAGAAIPLGLGFGIPFAAISALFYYSVGFTASGTILHKPVKKHRGIAFPTEFMDLISITKDNRAIFTSDLIHEYSHNARMKKKLFGTDSFLEEGIAAALSNRIMDDMGDKKPVLRAYGKLRKMNACLEIAYMLCFSKIISEHFEYSGGSTMVHLAEYKYGKGIYKELFKGKYDCLLD